MSEIENEIIMSDEIIKPKRGRPPKNSDELVKLDKEYFKFYYQKTCQKIECPNCGAETNSKNLKNHIKSIKCKYQTLTKQI
jgi:tRNA(Ile2) C34 agmatinyltransferase TiaS